MRNVFKFSCYLIGAAFSILGSMGCQTEPSSQSTAQAVPLFREVPPAESGVAFRNDLAEDTVWNILNYLYFYNGGGVAVGDLNADSLPDVYFSANQGPNRLYLNKGGLRFEEVTQAAGLVGQGSWKQALRWRM